VKELQVETAAELKDNFGIRDVDGPGSLEISITKSKEGYIGDVITLSALYK